MNANFVKYINSPLAWLKLESNATSLLSISFASEEHDSSSTLPDILFQTKIQLKEYFNGNRTTFEIDIAPKGTDFQQEVWKHVRKVEFGNTSSYLDIALKTGHRNNTRAVGLANGKNPIPIIIPCHRIIGTNGKLTGYAGGLERKRWLLLHEKQNSVSKNTLF